MIGFINKKEAESKKAGNTTVHHISERDHVGLTTDRAYIQGYENGFKAGHKAGYQKGYADGVDDITRRDYVEK